MKAYIFFVKSIFAGKAGRWEVENWIIYELLMLTYFLEIIAGKKINDYLDVLDKLLVFSNKNILKYDT